MTKNDEKNDESCEPSQSPLVGHGGVVELSSSYDPPIPLSGPDGEVFGYACPRCRRVKASVSCGNRASEIEANRQDAERCCICRDCGVEMPNRIDYKCAECRERDRVAWEATLPQRQAENARRLELQAASFALATDVDLARTLAARMSELSEEYYCAGWMDGLEYALWGMVNGGPRNYGLGELSEDEVRELRRLSEKAGGWIRFADDIGDKVFVTLADWLTHVEAVKSSKA